MAQVSSLLSSFPLLIVPVTHFFQQMSVRECTAVTISLNTTQQSKAKQKQNKTNNFWNAPSVAQARRRKLSSMREQTLLDSSLLALVHNELL